MCKKVTRLIVVIGFILQTSGCIFPISSTTIDGRVVDYKKQPVAGAKVTFGGTGGEVETLTGPDGTFKVTTRHRPSQMLNLKISKQGVGRFHDEFPGFAAPEDGKSYELMPIIGEIPATK